MDNHADPLSQIDAEIKKLRQKKPQDAADPKCAEIDANITALQWAREKYANSASGDRTFRSIGDRGQFLDVQAMRENWEKYKVYRAVPEGAQGMLHLLARGAQHARSQEDANALLEKLVEVLEFVWPTSSGPDTAIAVGKTVVLVPDKAGALLRHAHTCADFPHRPCIACETGKKEEPIPAPKENPPCAIPVLRADKGAK
jgi:hypothetical protein